MIKKFAISLAAASMALTAAPAIAQDDGEYVEAPRTTWELRFIDLAPGAEGEFLDRMEKYFNPAREKAGMKPVKVHYLHNGQYDMLLVLDMPDGMATFDTHRSDRRVAFQEALSGMFENDEARDKFFKEGEKLVEGTRSIFSHTHP